MKRLGKKQLEHIVIGAGLLGAGGGGSTAEGTKLIERILEFGSGVDLVSIEEIDDNDWGAVIAGMGSPKASLERVRTNSPRYALELLEEACNFKSSFVIPFELGAGNSLNPMLVAVQRGIPIVDGDPVCRAVPELQMNTFYLAGMKLSPLALASEEPISAVIRTEKPHDAERVTRAITTELAGVAAFATLAMKAQDMKMHIIPGTTTLVEKIGGTIEQARQEGENTAARVVEEFEGYLLGRGVISSLRGETRGGFDFGVVEVEGEYPLTVKFQNENMIALRGNTPVAIVPDLICSMDGNGKPLTNADLLEGMDIQYISFKAHSLFRGPRVYAMFTDILEAMGYSEGFVPVEDTIK